MKPVQLFLPGTPPRIPAPALAVLVSGIIHALVFGLLAIGLLPGAEEVFVGAVQVDIVGPPGSGDSQVAAGTLPDSPSPSFSGGQSSKEPKLPRSEPPSHSNPHTKSKTQTVEPARPIDRSARASILDKMEAEDLRSGQDSEPSQPSLAAQGSVNSTQADTTARPPGGREGGAYTQGDVDQPPRVARSRQPVYPAEARRRKLQGEVRLRMVVDAKGRVGSLTVVASTPPGVFDEAALRAVAQWSFHPALKNGRAVAAWVDIPVRFTLREK